MSTSRKRKPLSDDFVVSDHDSDNEAETQPPRSSKKSKTTTSPHFSSAASSLHPQQDAEGNLFWEISRARRVVINEYRGKQMVSIREYYEKDGKQLPGKKGITLTLEQYNALLGVVPGIHGVLREKGEDVVRVSYVDGAERKAEEAVNGEGGKGSESGGRRKNYEETDEEEED